MYVGSAVDYWCPLAIAANDYGLFKADEDPKMGRWLEMGRTLEYYILKSGVSLESMLLLINGVLGLSHLL